MKGKKSLIGKKSRQSYQGCFKAGKEETEANLGSDCCRASKKERKEGFQFSTF